MVACTVFIFIFGLTHKLCIVNFDLAGWGEIIIQRCMLMVEWHEHLCNIWVDYLILYI